MFDIDVIVCGARAVRPIKVPDNWVEVVGTAVVHRRPFRRRLQSRQTAHRRRVGVYRLHVEGPDRRPGTPDARCFCPDLPFPTVQVGVGNEVGRLIMIRGRNSILVNDRGSSGRKLDGELIHSGARSVGPVEVPHEGVLAV